MRAEIFHNRKNLSEPELETYAKRVGVEIPAWKLCLASDEYSKKVQADMRAGARLGIRGTPAFLIGLSDPNDPNKLRAVRLLEGAYPYPAFQEAIDSLLKDAGA